MELAGVHQHYVIATLRKLDQIFKKVFLAKSEEFVAQGLVLKVLNFWPQFSSKNFLIVS